MKSVKFINNHDYKATAELPVKSFYFPRILIQIQVIFKHFWSCNFQNVLTTYHNNTINMTTSRTTAKTKLS